MTLYEIDNEIMSCIDLETGEVVDLDRLEELQIERDKKIENVGCWIKNLDADAKAIKEERDALYERQKAAEKKADSLREWLRRALNGQSFSGVRCAVRFRASEAVVIEDAALIPKKYLVKTVKVDPDKKAIKEALANGLKVKGAAIEQRLNVQVK